MSLEKHAALAAALAVAVFAGLAAASPPKKPSLNGVTVAVAGDTVRVKTFVRSSVAVDSIWLVVALPNSGKPYANLKIRSVAAGVQYSAEVVWPGIPAGTYTGTVTARSYLSGQVSAATTRGYTATVVQGPPPPPSIDSVQVSAVRILPRAWAMGRGQSRAVCVAIGFPGDKWAMRASEAIECGTPYAATFSILQRAVSPAQQAYADQACIRWRTTGGTVTPGGCDA